MMDRGALGCHHAVRRLPLYRLFVNPQGQHQSSRQKERRAAVQYCRNIVSVVGEFPWLLVRRGVVGA